MSAMNTGKKKMILTILAKFAPQMVRFLEPHLRAFIKEKIPGDSEHEDQIVDTFEIILGNLAEHKLGFDIDGDGNIGSITIPIRKKAVVRIPVEEVGDMQDKSEENDGSEVGNLL